MIFVLVVPEKNTNIAMDKDSNFYDKISYSFRRRILLFSTLVVLLGVTLFMINGCSETSEPPDWGYMYHYYPLQEGHWTIYQVDSVAYNSLLDSVKTYRYYIKEEMGPLFTDLSGNQWTRVKADYSTDTTSGWSPLADYAQRITTQTAERFENNLHFIKMVFPFKKFSLWLGNSYIHYDDYFNCNFLGDWQYQYRELYASKTILGNTFDSVVVIQQVADSGLICKNLAMEMYAPQIGLIYKYIERLTTQKTTSDPFWMRAEDGYILTYQLIDWKQN